MIDEIFSNYYLEMIFVTYVSYCILFTLFVDDSPEDNIIPLFFIYIIAAIVWPISIFVAPILLVALLIDKKIKYIQKNVYKKGK